MARARVGSRGGQGSWSMMATSSVAAQVALAAVAAFSLLLAVVHVLKPEISPSWRMISEYEIGRYGWFMRLAFVCWSASVFAVAVASQPYVHFLRSAALFLVAVGPLGAAVFATEPITTPAGSTGVAHRLHAAFGTLFILGFPIAATLADGTAGWPAWLWSVPWIGLVACIGSAVTLQARGKRRTGPDVPIGWPNRFLVLTYVTWLAVAAWTILQG
jgi:hypothetical protein